MKKILFIVAVTLSVTMFAQKQIDEGVVISKQTMSSDNEQMNAHEEKRILRCKKMLKYQRF